MDVRILSERVKALDRLLTSQLKGQDEKVQLALTAAEKAITKAEAATEKRFEGVNEFREALGDVVNTRASKEELQSAVEKLEAQIDPLILYVTAQQGQQQGVGRTWATVTGTLLILIAIAGLYTKIH